MFTERSAQKELLDLGSDFYTPQEYAQCQMQLFKLNKWLGFFRSTRKFLQSFVDVHSVIDIGCGGGLFLCYLQHYLPGWQLVGCDVSKEAVQIAQLQTDTIEFHFQPHSYPSYHDASFDFVLTTLVCHHLDDATLVAFLQQCLRISKRAVIINDLHRHWLAEISYRIIRLFFGNRLIKHDGLISIQRSFIRSDWRNLLKQAGICHYQIRWCFPFRWQVILWKK